MNFSISTTTHVSCIVVVSALCLILMPAANGFQFYLHSGERRCFTESVPPNTKVLGEYTVSTGEGDMPVDISVRVPEEDIHLYHKKNIDHGKFAFVVPFGHSHEKWRILAAEMHRKKMLRNIGKVFSGKPAGNEVGDHRRKLLSSGTTNRDESSHRENTKERQFDEHGRAKPPSGHGKDPTTNVHEADDRHAHHDSYHEDRKDSRAHGQHHHDHYDDDYDDDIDDFDLDDYDGIDDEELDDDLAHEEAAHIKATAADAASDVAQQAELFDSRTFEICVYSSGIKGAHKRRVRLVIHKGETAHDYTRLAKKEHMTQLEISLRRVSEELHELMHELDKARQMEDSLRRVNVNTNGRVMMLAVLSVLSLVAVGSYQAVYTKRFLKRKKIL